MLPVNTQNALGIDIGSTTAKIVLVRSGQIVYEKYERQHAKDTRHYRVQREKNH